MAKPFSLNPVGDNYTELDCPDTVKVNVQLTTASILIGFGHGFPSTIYDSDETLTPIVASLLRRCDRIRVKNLVPNQPQSGQAVAYITALTAADG